MVMESGVTGKPSQLTAVVPEFLHQRDCGSTLNGRPVENRKEHSHNTSRKGEENTHFLYQRVMVLLKFIRGPPRNSLCCQRLFTLSPRALGKWWGPLVKWCSRGSDLYIIFLFKKFFYCYSITVVCLFSPSLHPTPAARSVF